MTPDFEKNELIPAVVQDARTGQVRMLGYMNREAFERTASTGELHLFSRSRGRLWRKGESSGNVHRVTGVSVDCDADALLVRAVPQGPTCHTGSPTCFSETAWGEPAAPAGALGALEAVVAARREAPPEGSYTASLFAAGRPKIAQKVGEEAVETVVAALAQDRRRVVEESADLLYHLTVLWSDRGVAWEEVAGELLRRRGGRP